MATPNDLYNMTPEYVTTEIYYLVDWSYNHIPEAGDECDLCLNDIETDLIEIRVLKDFNFDGRRIWRLATVWYKDEPIMVIQNAGREGSDYSKRFITNKNLFLEMCTHIKSLIPLDDWTEQIHPDSDFKELTQFYGNNLTGYFERY